MESQLERGETVPCSICSEEVPVQRALVLGTLVLCGDCVVEAYHGARLILEERGCRMPAISLPMI